VAANVVVLETIRGAKNKHNRVRFLCDCGSERTARATAVRRGLITQCATCAKAAAAKRGGVKRRQFSDDERVLRDKWSEYKRNAKRGGLVITLSIDQALSILTQACDYCGGYGGGIDRIDSGRGYDIDNVVPCCSICNYAKRDLPRDIFLSWVRRIYEHQSVLQRDRSILLRLAEQPYGRRPDHTGQDR
jgi:hypothetical protein